MNPSTAIAYRQTILDAKATLRAALEHEGLTPVAIATIVRRHAAILKSLQTYHVAIVKNYMDHNQAVFDRAFEHYANASFDSALEAATEEDANVLRPK